MKSIPGKPHYYRQIDPKTGKVYIYYYRQFQYPDGSAGYQAYAKNKADWDKKVAKIIEAWEKAKLGLVVNYPTATFEDMRDEFLANRKKVKALATYKQTKLYFDNKIMLYWKDMVVSKITNDDCQRLFEKLERQKFSEQVINRTRMVLNNFFIWNIKNHKCITDNPLSDGLKETLYEAYSKTQEGRKRKYLKEKMLLDFVDFISNSPALVRQDILLVYYGAIFHGARRGEAIAFQDIDIDRSNNNLHIRRQIIPDGTVTLPKSKKARAVPLHPLMHDLATVITMNQVCKNSDTDICIDECKCIPSYTFKTKQTETTGTWLTTTDSTTKQNTLMKPLNFVTKHHKKIVKAFKEEYPQWENEPLNFHVFRSYFTAVCVVQDMNSMKIAEYLGQQSVDTTFRHYYFDFEKVNKEEEVNPHLQRYDSKSVDSKTNLVRHSTSM